MMVLELQSLTKVFRDQATGTPFTAVDGVSLAISEGQFFTLLGPSGCGKTTILRMVAGFEPPTLGRIFANGQDITPVPAERRGLPVVFQNYALFPHMSVGENVSYPLRIKKRSKSEIQTRLHKTLELLNLRGLEGRRPEELSGGQQQRVALARALISEPKMMLFDEPLSNLDAKLRAQMRIELKRLQKQTGLTSLYVTHDQEEAMALSDVVVVMNRGRIEQSGTPEEIYFSPANRFVAEFIGSANFLSARAHSQTQNGKYTVTLWGKDIPDVSGIAGVAGECCLMVRPEAVRFAGEASFGGKVTVLNFLGSTTVLEMEVENQRIVAERPSDDSDEAFPVGRTLSFSLDPKRLFVLPSET